MGNLTVASISMGNVKGILKKIPSESEIKMSYFIYSSETDIKVSGQMASDIHTLLLLFFTLHEGGDI